MKSIWTVGEALCEIMRIDTDAGLDKQELFNGPYPSVAPAIFIDPAATLGTPSGLIGTVGNDAFGACIRRRLLADGADCSLLATNAMLSTAVAFVAYTSDGDRTFIFHIGNAAAGDIHYPEHMPENVGIFHVMGCAMMPSPAMADCVMRAAEHYYEQGALISFDPNIRIESLHDQDLQELVRPIMERCSILLPGVEELMAITGADSVDAALEKAFANPVLKVVVLKDGGRGCRVITRGESFDLPVCKVEVLDSTGAGDSFDAGFLTSYLSGLSLRQCAENASATGALNCAAFGPMEGEITQQTVAELVKKNYHR